MTLPPSSSVASTSSVQDFDELSGVSSAQGFGTLLTSSVQDFDTLRQAQCKTSTHFDKLSGVSSVQDFDELSGVSSV